MWHFHRMKKANKVWFSITMVFLGNIDSFEIDAVDLGAIRGIILSKSGRGNWLPEFLEVTNIAASQTWFFDLKGKTVTSNDLKLKYNSIWKYSVIQSSKCLKIFKIFLVWGAINFNHFIQMILPYGLSQLYLRKVRAPANLEIRNFGIKTNAFF